MVVNDKGRGTKRQWLNPVINVHRHLRASRLSLSGFFDLMPATWAGNQAGR